jgi:hypothetical protein
MPFNVVFLRGAARTSQTKWSSGAGAMTRPLLFTLTRPRQQGKRRKGGELHLTLA